MIYSRKELKQLSKLQASLCVLEKEQAQNREAVRTALKEKDVDAIKRLSAAIRDNRRKPNGLRELNKKIIDIWNLF